MSRGRKVCFLLLCGWVKWGGSVDLVPHQGGILDFSAPAVCKLGGWPERRTQSRRRQKRNPLLVFADTSPSSRDRRGAEPGAHALEPPPSGKPGVDFHTFWSGVKGHLGGGDRLRGPAGFEAAAIGGAPAGLVAQCGSRSPAGELRALPAGAAGGRGAGRRRCPRGGSGRRRARAAVRRAAGSGQQRAQAVAVASALGSERAGGRRRRCPGRAHTRAHTHTHTHGLVHTHTRSGAHTRRAGRREAARRGSAAAAACSAGGRQGWRAAPAPRLGGSVQPARPLPSDPPPGVARPHALQRRRSSARPRAALRSPEGAGDEGTMYRDPEAASPGKRGPARAGAPRSGGQDGGSARRRLGAPARGCCPPELHGLPPGSSQPRGRGLERQALGPRPPAVQALPGLMPGAGFAVSPQGPPPHPQQPKDNVCGGARSRCPRGSRAVPSEATLGPQHQSPGGASAGGPQGKHPGQLLAKVVGTGERSDIGSASCELRGCQGASGNLVQRPGRGASGGGGNRRSVEEGGRSTEGRESRDR